jgi:creatine kinase
MASSIEEKLAAGAASSQKGGKNPAFDSGGVVKGDAKDSDDFEYLTYGACPTWNTDASDKLFHKSLMVMACTPELFAKLKDVQTASGYTFSNAIQTGTETPHLGVGLTAGDEECYEAFAEIINPIIAGWHGGYDPTTMKHPTDLEPENLTFSDEQRASFNTYVVSTRIRAARNIRGKPLPPGSTRESAAAVEGILKTTFEGLEGDLKGTYYPLGGMDAATVAGLQSQGFLFQKPKTTDLLTNAGAARFWPESRGIFHNDNKTALAWCNEEDHCRIISMSNGGNVKAVFARFAAISDNMKQSAEAAGAKLMHTANLGFLGTCPSNIGTGLRGSVMIKIPNFNKNLDLLEEVCDGFDLQPRGSNGEHSEAIGGKFDVSNKQRIGFSEVQLVQKMIDGVTKLIALEQRLAAGASAADIEKELELA